MSVITTATGEVSAPIAVGFDAESAVAITPDGKHAYVTNKGDGTVSVITTATNVVSATIPVGKIRSGSRSLPTANTSTSPTSTMAQCR